MGVSGWVSSVLDRYPSSLKGVASMGASGGRNSGGVVLWVGGATGAASTGGAPAESVGIGLGRDGVGAGLVVAWSEGLPVVPEGAGCGVSGAVVGFAGCCCLGDVSGVGAGSAVRLLCSSSQPGPPFRQS